MQYQKERTSRLFVTAFSIFVLLFSGSSAAQQTRGGGQSMNPAKARVIEYWTSQRRANAIPRDFVIDSRGLGYLRRPDGSLQPYGHQIVAENAADSPKPNAKPSGAAGGGTDNVPPSISAMDPGSSDEIGGAHTFSATVTDNVGVKSVSFTIQYPNGSTTQTFSANAGAGDSWSVTLSGFTDGAWSWWVVAKDTAKKGGNTETSAAVDFTVDTGGGGEAVGGDDTVSNAEWKNSGAVQTAAGRLYFEMPNNAKRKGPWSGFVCSGTAVTDNANERSIILTAAHCVYDDANKAFARNAMFIPDQATGGSATDLNCNNDPMGCWVPSFGVVDIDWKASTFPANIPWDYAFYVVDDTGAHSGKGTEDSLAVAAGTLTINFANNMPYFDDETPGVNSDDFTYALGYSYDVDPNFMYCAEDMTKEGADNWWLPNCGLSGGSSGGPWVQPMVSGNGPIISVNSWGYSGSPGMAGPKLFGTSAECVFNTAESTSWSSVSSTDGDAGVAVDCP